MMMHAINASGLKLKNIQLWDFHGWTFCRGITIMRPRDKGEKWDGAFCADSVALLVCLWINGIAGDITAAAFSGAAGELIQVEAEAKGGHLHVCVCVCLCVHTNLYYSGVFMAWHAYMCGCVCVCIRHQSGGKPVCVRWSVCSWQSSSHTLPEAIGLTECGRSGFSSEASLLISMCGLKEARQI